jgi:hypothetical protein
MKARLFLRVLTMLVILITLGGFIVSNIYGFTLELELLLLLGIITSALGVMVSK